MKLFLVLIFITIMLITGGCATTPIAVEQVTAPTKTELMNGNYGKQISKAEFVNAIRNGSGLYDPYSAMIACSEPKKGWVHDKYEPLRFGYLANCSINAKNLHGGYVAGINDFTTHSLRHTYAPHGLWQAALRCQHFRGYLVMKAL